MRWLVIAYSAYGEEDAAIVTATTREDAIAAAIIEMDLDEGVVYRYSVTPL